MAYFPFYIDIENKKILVVGGGTVALRKIEKLTPFSPDITVVAPKICDEIKALNVKIIDRRFCDSDLDGAFCVVSATDDETRNGRIFPKNLTALRFSQTAYTAEIRERQGLF